MHDPLSVVVPTRDRPAQLDACLAALRLTLRPEDELIVVDSASRHADVAEAAARHGGRVVRCCRPGAARARNAGAATARHALLAFVDDDVRVPSDWAEAMATALSRDDVAFVTGSVAVPPWQPRAQREVAIYDAPEARPITLASAAPLGSSANLGVRAEALELIGGFDESLGGGARFQAAEDLDLFDRLLGAGLRGRYDPSVSAWHEQWRTRRQLLVLDWRYGVGAGARLAKLVRTDRRRALRAARESLWVDGFALLWRGIRVWQEFLVLTTALRIAGTAVGFVGGFAVPVRHGRYAPSRQGAGA